MPRVPCSLYPTTTCTTGTTSSSTNPPNVLLRISSEPWTFLDQLVIASSSLFLVGSIAWVPALYAYLYKKWKRVQNKRRKALYGSFILAITALMIAGPQRQPKFADRIKFRDWKIWQFWCRFVALEVWRDTKKQDGISSVYSSSSSNHENYKTQQNITAIVPHGIFPFAIGVAGVPGMAKEAFGKLRIMTATAINLFPLVRDVVRMVNNV